MSVVNWDDFRQRLTPDSVSTVRSVLQELARWWLTDRAKCMLAELDQTDYWTSPPGLPTQSGACWILTVNPDSRTYELLEPAFLFPLIWVGNRSHDARLPPSLRAIAQEVQRTLAVDPLVAESDWGLQIHFESEPWNDNADNAEMDYPDFSELAADRFDFRSGWAPLAAGLLSAARGVAANPAVWATGCWDGTAGVTEVGGLEQKLQLADTYFSAHETAGRATPFFMVPSANLIEANRFAARANSKLTPVAFPAGQLEPPLAFSGHLALLRVQPPDNASVEDHVAYYKSVLSDDRELAEQYYQRVLYPMVVRQCQQRMGPIEPMPTHLVTVVSPNIELVRLAVEVFRVRHCVMLYTVPSDASAYTRQITDMTRQANQTAEDCRKLGCVVHPEPFAYDTSQADFREVLSRTFARILEKHLADVPAECIVLDMQSAHKIFNYVFDHAIARPGNLMYWIDHSWIPADRTPHPLTERFIVWRAGDDWSKTSSRV